MHTTGLEDYFIIKDNKKMRFGYTTGTCAAAASRAAAWMLLTGGQLEYVRVHTPKGIDLTLEILDITRRENFVSCAIRKDGGDDPDATHGLLIYADVSKTEDGLRIDGGEGVGRVTRPGMQQNIGEAAINPVPMKMIRENVLEVCEQTGYTGGISVIIRVPGGEEKAKKTFNPRLGIEGGISILGTSGIVEPMSEKALIASIHLEMDMRIAKGHQYLLVTPGNYGETFVKNTMHLDTDAFLQCSNYVGETVDAAVNRSVQGLLFVSHIGKFIKVAGGIMNTHSRDADCRAELMAAYALRAGASAEQTLRILDSNTTDEAVEMLAEMGILEKTMKLVMPQVKYYLQHRAAGAIQTEAVIYCAGRGIIGQTDGAAAMIERFQSRQQGQMTDS